MHSDPDASAMFTVALASAKPVEPKVSEEEWNFKKCPTALLPFCQTYEYGRSSPAMLKRVRWWRQEEFAEADHRIISNYQLSAVQPMDLFRLFPEFPQTPWLALDRSLIAQRIKSLPKREPILVRSLPVDSLRDYGDYQDVVSVLEAFQTTTIQPMEINWFFHDKNLIVAFKKWLAENRPYAAKEKRGRTEPRVLLNALAAKRLLDEHSVADCQDITGTVLGEPLFRGDSNWYDAKAKAEAYLAERLPPIPVEKFGQKVNLLADAGFTEVEVNQLWQHLIRLKIPAQKLALRPDGDAFVAAMRALLKKLTEK